MIKWIFTLLVSLTISPLFAQNNYSETIPKTPLNTSISILNDRIWLNFPLGTTGQDNNSGSGNHQMQLNYTLDDFKLFFRCSELYGLGIEDLNGTINEDFNKERTNFETEYATYDTELRIVKYVPISMNDVNNSIFINGMIIEMPDKSLIRIDAYIGSNAITYRKAFVELTESIFKSIQLGKRKLNLEARDENIELFNGKSIIHLKFPDQFLFIKKENPGNSIYQIRRIVAVNQQAKAQAIIYSGEKPSMFFKNLGFTEENKSALEGKLIGQTIEWNQYLAEGNDVYLIEQMIPMNMGNNETKFHVAVFGTDDDEVAILKQIVEESVLEIKE